MMNTPSHRSTQHDNEAGQAAVLMAFLLFLAFLAFAALAIDGSMTYLARRDLQNVADSAALAACRVIASNDTSAGDVTTTAMNAAKNSIATNLGGWAPYAGANPPTSNNGSGSGLIQGMEIGDPVVRVALLRRVPTVLTQFVGRGDSYIDAKAMCNSRAGGGLMPIAVQRYDYGGTWRDFIANKNASGTSLPVNTAPPVPYPNDSVTETLPSPPARYPPNFLLPVPLPQYQASDGGPADQNTGPIVSLVGQTAETNDPPNDMSGLILLDIRNISAGAAGKEYYNGVSGNANSLKNVTQGWIYDHGYPGPYPEPGSQVAILSGVSAAFGPKAMWDAGYRDGDTVAAIIYDGYVWTKPDFQVTLTPKSDTNGIRYSGYPDTSAITYDVKIARAGPASAQWFNPLDFSLKFGFSEAATAATLPLNVQLFQSDGITPVPQVGADYYVPSVPEATGWQGILSISGAPSITQTAKFLSGLNLLAETSEVIHGASSNFGFGSITAADHTVRTNSGRLVVRQGDPITLDVYTFGDNVLDTNSCKNTPVTADITDYPVWGDVFSSSQAVGKVNLTKNQDKKVSVSLAIKSTAPTGSYTLRFTVNSGNQAKCGPPSLPMHSVTIPIEITPGGASSPGTDNYVVVQGYAVFRIVCINETSSTDPTKNCGPNDVWVYAITSMLDNYEDITYGLQPRLVPWS